MLTFAHRGGMADRPENTLAAFAHARAAGVRGVETDAWLSADSVAVLLHDGAVRRGLRRHAVSTLAAADLPVTVPSIADLYTVCGAAMHVAVDVLDPGAAPALVEAARAAGADALARLWLCSTSVELLESWRDLDPRVRLVHSDPAWRDHRSAPEAHVRALAERGVHVLNLRGRDCTPGITEVCHRHGVLLFAWGVRTLTAMRRLRVIGADAVMSDHVARLVALQREGGAAR